MIDDKFSEFLAKNIDPSKLHSFVRDGELIVPVYTDAAKPVGPMTPEQFMKFTPNMTDREMNELIYRQVKESIEMGLHTSWPEDDWGTLCWFEHTFITPEMRQVFPAIAKEFLMHEPQIGTDFTEVPVDRMNEKTWDDAFHFRILAMMIQSARRGSVYSRNFLISLYKVYYRSEYNRVKKLRRLTFLDVLNLHDEDCKRRGYPSGHSTDGKTTFRDYVIEQRRHEAGWTTIESIRSLEPSFRPEKAPAKHGDLNDQEQAEADTLFRDSCDYISSIADAPEEPPLQPVSSRLFIMCEMLRIPIDETCNAEAVHMNRVTESLLNMNFLGNVELRSLVDDVVERCREYITSTLPETADPALYQVNDRYVMLEKAECVLWGAFRKYDRNIRIPYDSRKFDLPKLMAEVSVSLHQYFPGKEQNFYELQILSMVQYLCECLCDLMISRDRLLDDLLHISVRTHQEEWHAEKDPLAEEQAEKLLRSMADLHGTKYVKPEIEPYVEPVIDSENVDDLKAEVERLRGLLAEKESVLSESEQKVIRQRALYEQEKTRRHDLEKKLETAATEHTELIALREYVYSLQTGEEIEELDEATQEQMVKDLQDKNVAILGGTERWVKRMKRLFPRWKFVSVDDDSIGGFNALESASYIYMYTGAMKHMQYFRAMNLIRRDGRMLFYLGSTNTSENIRRFYQDLCSNLRPKNM